MDNIIRDKLEQLFLGLSQEHSPYKLNRPTSDLFVRIDADRMSVYLFGDDDEHLASCVLPLNQITHIDYQNYIKQRLCKVLATLEEKSYWKQELFKPPFSISLVDEHFTHLDELLFIDEDWVQLTTPLLENLDEDLSKFIEELLQS